MLTTRRRYRKYVRLGGASTYLRTTLTAVQLKPLVVLSQNKAMGILRW